MDEKPGRVPHVNVIIRWRVNWILRSTIQEELLLKVINH
jgi:hypothetical protein